MFPRDLADGRSTQKLFFGEWLGGPHRYSEQATAGLRHRHDGLPITPALTGRWLGHFRRAIDSSGSWIGASWTGNQGRKDDPEYVRALLRHGARPNDRRIGDPKGMTGVRALHATALHYATKAGFLRTIEVLIDHGADLDARDSHGRAPLDWLEQAAPSVSRAAVRDLLAPGRHR